MTLPTAAPAASAAPGAAHTERVDVLVVGAGISGIDAAWHLRQQCPGKQFVVLDAQDGHGGTWRTHRYPGIRSDSDLFTFGFGFKPWQGPPIASAAQIQAYLAEVIDENDLAQPHPLRAPHRLDRVVVERAPGAGPCAA